MYLMPSLIFAPNPRPFLFARAIYKLATFGAWACVSFANYRLCSHISVQHALAYGSH
jgi:hypothetical protein